MAPVDFFQCGVPAPAEPRGIKMPPTNTCTNAAGWLLLHFFNRSKRRKGWTRGAVSTAQRRRQCCGTKRNVRGTKQNYGHDAWCRGTKHNAMAWRKTLRHKAQCRSTKNKPVARRATLQNKEQRRGSKNNATASLRMAKWQKTSTATQWRCQRRLPHEFSPFQKRE